MKLTGVTAYGVELATMLAALLQRHGYIEQEPKDLDELLQCAKAANRSMGKCQYLDLSTCHVAEETAHWLDENLCTGITIAPYEYGAFVSVPSELPDIDGLDCPKDLKKVLRFARQMGCDMVRFDKDADILPDLQHFDW